MPLTSEQVLDAFVDGVLVYDEVLACTYANPVALAMLGADPRGRNINDVLDGLDGDLFGVRQTVRMHGKVAWRGGPALVVVVQPGDAGGHVLLRAPDDMEHERLRRVEEEHEQLLVTLRSIGDGVIVTDAEGRVRLLNPMAEEHTGWTQTEARGRFSREILSLHDELRREPVPDPICEVLNQGRPISLHDHTLMQARDGNRYPIAYTSSPIVGSRGDLHGAVFVFRDMRSRRRLEEELIRSAKLQAVGDLAGNIAHDFNNVLAAILGSVSLALRSTRPGERLHSHLTLIDAACQRGRDLAQELLTFSRGGAPVKEPISIEPLIRQACDVALRDARSTAKLEIAPDLPKIRGDVGQLRQAIQNLLRSANEGMPSGGVVRVSAKSMRLERGQSVPLREGEYVQLEVADQGQGIPEDQLAHIFDPFYTTRPHATGLGLATVDSIVHAHNGYIAAQSKLGEGTVFTIWLPAEDTRAPPETQANTRPAPASVRQVLVMDDDPLVRSMLSSMLEELGYSVTATANGDEAVRVYGEALRSGRPFALAILDLSVPDGMGGVPTIRELATLDATVRAIVTSGYYEDPVLANYREYGFADVLPKPFGLETLKQKLRQVLGEDDIRVDGESPDPST